MIDSMGAYFLCEREQDENHLRLQYGYILNIKHRQLSNEPKVEESPVPTPLVMEFTLG